jgi:alkylhydroperoxidase family enzyme
VIFVDLACENNESHSSVGSSQPDNHKRALAEYRTSPLFSERERTALAYVEEATRNKRVSDATFEALRRNFSEEEIVEIT